MKVYSNPKCSKCVETLSLLEEQGVEVEIINYLETPPTKEELREIIQKNSSLYHNLVFKNDNF